MRKFGFIALAVLLSFGLIACKGNPERIRMATGGSTGNYYSYGFIVSQILSEKVKIPISVQSTAASKANIQLIDAGQAELAIVQNDVMDYAYRGVDLFNGERITSFSSVAAIYAEVCQVIANPASGITTIADLRGKNVGVGEAGSGTEFNSHQILEAYGVTTNDIIKHNLGFGASADGLRDNTIDAFFCIAGAPTPVIVDLANSMDILILQIDGVHVASLIDKSPFYTQFSIPGGTYRNHPETVNTVAVKATIIASTKMSADTVYKLTKTLFESKHEIEQAHVKGNELSTTYAVEGISIPFHPGAARYFREIGALR